MSRLRTAIAVVATCVAVACAPDPPNAIVQVRVESCDLGLELGSGAFVGRSVVLTAAHVVAGGGAISVVTATGEQPATIVGFDPINDLAYLTTTDSLGSAVPLAHERPARGRSGVAYVVRDGAVAAVDITVVRPVTIRTEDIYIDAITERPGYELEGAIHGGDSGGVVIVDGEAVGVIWARSSKAADRAYAIDTVTGRALIDQQLATGTITHDAAGTPIDLNRCH